MISAPAVTEHRSILADWLELLALSSRTGQVPIRSLEDVLDLTQDSEEEDIADFDLKRDAIVARVTTEIQDRVKCLQLSYPFSINDDGSLLRLEKEIRPSAAVYLCCLLMSHVSDSPILGGLDLGAEARSGQRIFQICATLSAAGWCRGPAVSFGWPRLDRTSFSEKLAQVYANFGDGTPRGTPLPAAPEHIKDGGIDIIAWRHANDSLPGTLYLLGQVASGKNWKDKSVLQDIENFHWAWFEVQPASQAQGAMFVPFCVTDAGEEGGDELNQDRLLSRMQFIAKEFGQFFYRYRLPLWVEHVEELHKSGVSPLDGIDEIPHIVGWVRAFTARLMNRGT